jgi:hypothetical protein
MGKWSEKIPSFLWIPIIVGGGALIIGGMLAGFFALGYLEGFASILLLIAGWYGFRAGNNSPELNAGSLGIAVGITFFALMGMALDQTGNYLYNKPIEWIFCPAETELVRETIKRGARGGGVSLSQSFNCVAENGGAVVRSVGFLEFLGVRFFEYVLLGYILLYLSRFYGWLRRKRQSEQA